MTSNIEPLSEVTGSSLCDLFGKDFDEDSQSLSQATESHTSAENIKENTISSSSIDSKDVKVIHQSKHFTTVKAVRNSIERAAAETDACIYRALSLMKSTLNSFAFE